MGSVLARAVAVLLALPSTVVGQGGTTAAIRGQVRTADGTTPDGARVRVVHAASGFVVQGEVRHGRFLIQGLEVGGPYTIQVRHIGFHPAAREQLHLSLGAELEIQFELQPVALQLDSIPVVAAPFPLANAHGGTATTVADSLLHRLPSLNRNLYDFARLAPQVSTRISFAAGGLSGAGMGFRLNSFLVNGVPQRSVGGQVPPEFSGGKSVPLEAVREYQVLVAPFDVRYGDFAGALVNAVTRSGTNQFHGSVFAHGRSDALARPDGAIARAPYQRAQYGFSVGGPVLRDRLHFFIAPEFQHLTSPAPGPYLGQPAGAGAPVPVAAADLSRLATIMRTHGLTAGSGGPVENRNPLRSLFARVDLALPAWNSRAIAWVNETQGDNLTFSRPATGAFPLTTNQVTQASTGWNVALQLLTALPRAGGGQNEFLLAYRNARGRLHPDVRQPLVSVAVPGTSGGVTTLVTGTPVQAHGGGQGYHAMHLRNDLALPLGPRHTVSLGVDAERFRIERAGVSNAYGSWTFASLDSLGLGIADRFEVARDFGSAEVPLVGAHLATHAGTRWQVSERVTVTMGLRAEWLLLDGRAPYNPAVDSIFSRRTDAPSPRQVHLSPRLGFTWDPSGSGRDQVRGGLGVFTGRPPLAWLHAARVSHGTGIGVLRCGRLPTDLGPPPPFTTDFRTPPGSCANGQGLTTAPRGEVDLLDGGGLLVHALRGVLAWDRRLSGDWLATLELVATRSLAEFAFVNLNLAGPQGTDRHGRVLYGTIGPTGLATPSLRSNFAEVIELQRTAELRAHQASLRLARQFRNGAAVTAHYTHTRVRDTQTPLRVNVAGLVNWSSRAVSGRHDDLAAGISLNDIPHRLVVAGTWRAPWPRWATEFSFQYVGESGGPFTYLAWGAVRGRGDLNADGSNQNDPIHVPRDAADPDEIRFVAFTRQLTLPDGTTRTDTVTAERQATDFEALIEETPCLARQRGRILARNSCREPWAHTTIASVRQAVPLGGRTLEIQLDLFNVLNLLRRDWGQYRLAVPSLLEHVAQTPESPAPSQPVFRFNPEAPRWTALPAESEFQFQLALRYRF